MPGTAGRQARTHSRGSITLTCRNVHDVGACAVVGCSDGPTAPRSPPVVLTDLVALVLFAAAGSASPGPNNTLLLASGVRFGFARTLPHVIGSAVGIGALIVLVGLGVGTAI